MTSGLFPRKERERGDIVASSEIRAATFSVTASMRITAGSGIRLRFTPEKFRFQLLGRRVHQQGRGTVKNEIRNVDKPKKTALHQLAHVKLIIFSVTRKLNQVEH